LDIHFVNPTDISEQTLQYCGTYVFERNPFYITSQLIVFYQTHLKGAWCSYISQYSTYVGSIS